MRSFAPLVAMAGLLLAQGGPTNVEVAAVKRKKVVPGRTFVGTVVPSRTSTVGTEVEGLVVAYLVHEGERVEEGQPLCRLRTRALELDLAVAQALLLQRKQELLELENGARPEERAQAQARLGQAKADLELSRWKEERTRALFEKGSVTEDEVKETSLAAARGEEKVREEEEGVRLVEAGPRAERKEQARAGVAAQQAAVDRLDEDLKRHTILAPFAGYVVREHTEVGQWLGKGSPVVEIAALDEADILVPVLEDYVGGVRLGAKAAVTVGALPGVAFDGRVAHIVPSGDARARTFPVKVRVANAPEGGSVRLKAGMFARVVLAVGEPADTLLVPKDALVLGGPSPMVYVVGEADSTVRPVPVEAGLAEDGWIAVTGPVAEGQKVVVRGNERLRPGQQVTVVEGRGE